MDKSELRQHCEREIADYEYLVSEFAVGNPCSDEEVEKLLKECKAAVVEPYKLTIELRDNWEQMEADPAIVRDVFVVADDQDGFIVFYSPITMDFGLAEYIPGDNSGIPSSINVYGDFVGTFMSR